MVHAPAGPGSRRVRMRRLIQGVISDSSLRAPSIRAGITGCGLGLCVLVWPPSTFAAPEPPNESTRAPGVFSFIEEETVSTAIRREQPISQAPSNVYVITAEDIRQSGAPDVPTILRRIPG